MSKPEFVYVTYINTTPEKLWEALTSPEFTQQYWGGRRIQSDWKVGSPVQHIEAGGDLDWHGEVLQSDPLKLLSYTFDLTPPGQSGGEPASRVTFQLQPYGNAMRLTTTHDNFEAGSEVLQGVSQGWPGILSSMKSLLEAGRALEMSACKA
jgi:uncharacterized protein YndB with AHSA1/START domain